MDLIPDSSQQPAFPAFVPCFLEFRVSSTFVPDYFLCVNLHKRHFYHHIFVVTYQTALWIA